MEEEAACDDRLCDISEEGSGGTEGDSECYTICRAKGEKTSCMCDPEFSFFDSTSQSLK